MACAMAKPGVTTESIDEAVHEMVLGAGAYPSPLNYGRFLKSVCTSVNECICHGIPDSRPLRDGDILNVDVTVFLDAAIAICGPGVPVNRIGGEIQKVADAA